MSLLADLHMHSVYSEDSKASVADMVTAGMKAGLDTMCFTEHIDLDFPDKEGAWEADPSLYGPALRETGDQFQGKMCLLFGAEFGMQLHLKDRYAALDRKYGFDYILASMHILEGKDPYFPSFWEGKSEQAVIRQYFEATLENLRLMDTYDALAHLDYVVRYSPSKGATYHFEDYLPVIDEILRLLIRERKALEINTSPYRKGFGQPNPCAGILQRYYDLGGRLITIGSDAHTPEDVGRDIEKAAALAKSTGFEYSQIYVQHTPRPQKL